MDLFHLLPEYRLLICKRCRSGVIASRIVTHLKSHDIEHKVRTQAVQWATPLDIIATEAELLEFRAPEHLVPRVPHIAVEKANGCRCRYDDDCKMVTRNEKRMREHLRTRHGWNAGRGRGQPRREQRANEDRPWRSGVWYQQFFRGGVGSEYFEVLPPVPVEAPAPTALRSAFHQKIEQFLAAGDETQVPQEEDKVNEFVAPNAWVTRLGAAQHL